MKHLYSVILCIFLFLCGCQPAKHAIQKPQQKVVILFDNDVHCAIDGYSKIAALRAEQLAQTPYVSVVSAGDFVQGSAVGSLSKGEYIIDLMNKVPYDVVTIGNHEFDYGIEQQQHLMKRLTASCVCCNYTSTVTGKLIYAPSCIKTYGNIKVAYIGVATPTTVTSSTPTFFQDENGKQIYSFHADDVFDLIQREVNRVRRQGADYVIILSHLGDDTLLDNSVEMIGATTGIDAVFDGHQHHILNLKVANAEGDSVLLASTGTAFLRLGQCTIDTTGQLSVKLIDSQSYTSRNAAVDSIQATIDAQLSDITNKVLGYTQIPLLDVVNGQREVRRSETNLSDFLTDAYRAYTQADICLMNGGSIRHSIPAGEITFGALFSATPFNNTMHKVRCTGQQVLDALEVGIELAPEENGGFMQVSGLRYTYRTDIPSSVQYDRNGLFIGIGDTRRIVSVEVEKNGEWENLEPDKTYTVGGQSYVVVNKGASGALRYLEELECEHISDIDAAVLYVKALGEITAEQYGQPQGRIKHVEIDDDEDDEDDDENDEN